MTGSVGDGRDTRPRLLLATRSAGKLRELRPLFDAAGIRILDLDEAGLPESPAEDGLECFTTFEENAAAKARYFFDRAGGLPVVSDDSGLEVAALGGAPGVRSKRWSERPDLSGQALDDENNRRLLDALGGGANRAARYVCVAAIAEASGVRTFRGECAGRILEAPRGAGGFGYDPLFESAELGVTFGEASLEAKERVSHRGRAFRAMLAYLVSSIDSTSDSRVHWTRSFGA